MPQTVRQCHFTRKAETRADKNASSLGTRDVRSNTRQRVISAHFGLARTTPEDAIPQRFLSKAEVHDVAHGDEGNGNQNQ